jgi:hypothetical protein
VVVRCRVVGLWIGLVYVAFVNDVGVGGGVGGIGNVGPDLGVKGNGGSALVQLVLRAVSWSFTSMSGVVG